MARQEEINAFLKSIMPRASKLVLKVVRDEHLAMDIVQEAATKLIASYAKKSIEDMSRLFPRILRNATNDWFRRQRVRTFWTPLLSMLDGHHARPEDNLAEHFHDHNVNPAYDCIVVQSAYRAQLLAAISDEIEQLPRRQREAFVMRYGKEMSIAETAIAMRCSEGSIKTHCSRASRSLARALRVKGIEPWTSLS